MNKIEIELDGVVRIVERNSNDEVVSSSQLDNQLVLKILRRSVELGIEMLVEEYEKNKKPDDIE